MASPGEVTLKLVTFTEADCKLIALALGHYAEEYATTDDMPRINRLIERLS